MTCLSYDSNCEIGNYLCYKCKSDILLDIKLAENTNIYNNLVNNHNNNRKGDK